MKRCIFAFAVMLLLLLCACGAEEASPELNDGLTLSLFPETLSQIGASFILKNDTDNECRYSGEYTIETLEDGEWKELLSAEGSGEAVLASRSEVEIAVR